MRINETADTANGMTITGNKETIKCGYIAFA